MEGRFWQTAFARFSFRLAEHGAVLVVRYVISTCLADGGARAAEAGMPCIVG